jgi:hypothetical protein
LTEQSVDDLEGSSLHHSNRKGVFSIFFVQLRIAGYALMPEWETQPANQYLPRRVTPAKES